ncbi:MAG: hypothetical protein DDT30_01123 [Dehalococcoidia bacterium]|nr:hypothetical protein [Bacillota bacterium]MBT9166231.1 hypothetical protein [Chloroflexota bacterium]
MSEEERKRLAIMARVKEGEMTIQEGSEVLRISYRQARHIPPPKFPCPTLRRHMSLLMFTLGEDSIPCTSGEKRRS